MAKDAKTAVEGAEAAPAKGNKKLLIIIITVVVLVLGLGGTAAYVLLKHGPAEDDDGEVAVEKVKPAKKKKVDRGAQSMRSRSISYRNAATSSCSCRFPSRSMMYRSASR